ncbi:hypothetical protein GALMADRAFT_134495 [Galerina marginata CBS 339.88]|uniref:HAT C-terminal dimerisation domain-containing protein n=1 Tax=Galerina marginata (strain CBS 339.88) TaxID=685588 RepID=A0A067TSW9_GALM3|nr:hypothetical protein GALMADRAFT_134495 [Galerina marginata CBS 339.88]
MRANQAVGAVTSNEGDDFSRRPPTGSQTVDIQRSCMCSRQVDLRLRSLSNLLLAQILSTLLMASHDGTNGNIPFLVLTEWLDYLTIPATSVDVEWIFSHGRLLKFSPIVWSLLGYVDDDDLKAVVTLPDLWEDKEEEEIELD